MLIACSVIWKYLYHVLKSHTDSQPYQYPLFEKQKSKKTYLPYWIKSSCNCCCILAKNICIKIYGYLQSKKSCYCCCDVVAARVGFSTIPSPFHSFVDRLPFNLKSVTLRVAIPPSQLCLLRVGCQLKPSLKYISPIYLLLYGHRIVRVFLSNDVIKSYSLWSSHTYSYTAYILLLVAVCACMIWLREYGKSTTGIDVGRDL